MNDERIEAPGFPAYWVYRDGRVVTKETGREKTVDWTNQFGYGRVSLYPGGKTVFVHTLVLTAFKGPRPTGKVGNHEDGNKRNNHADNLEWMTQKENIEHAHRTGLVSKEMCRERYVKQMADPEKKARMDAAQRSPERNQKRRDTMNRNWADPAWRTEQGKRIAEGKAKRHVA